MKGQGLKLKSGRAAVIEWPAAQKGRQGSGQANAV